MDGAFVLRDAGGQRVVDLPILRQAGASVAAVTTRDAGDCGLRTAPDRAAANRAAVAAALGFRPAALATVRQVHGAAVVYAAPGPWLAPEADALVTDSPVVVLGVLAADCAPIFLLDPRRRVAGLAHAGWRGTARGVVLRTLEVMAGRWGTNPADVVAVVGPCIGPCCYEVGEEVVEALSELLGSEVPVRRETGRRPRLDLRTANARQLVQAGVDPRRVVTVDLCTSCRADLFFSHRREGTAAGRMLALLQLKANGPTC